MTDVCDWPPLINCQMKAGQHPEPDECLWKVGEHPGWTFSLMASVIGKKKKILQQCTNRSSDCNLFDKSKTQSVTVVTGGQADPPGDTSASPAAPPAAGAAAWTRFQQQGVKTPSWKNLLRNAEQMFFFPQSKAASRTHAHTHALARSLVITHTQTAMQSVSCWRI